MLIAFKDAADGVYQVEVPDENHIPPWAKGMTRLTEAQRLQAFPPPPPAPAPVNPVDKLKSFLAANPDVAAILK